MVDKAIVVIVWGFLLLWLGKGIGSEWTKAARRMTSGEHYQERLAK